MKPGLPIPTLMKRLPLDHRGYPIPFVVQRDDKGLPLFVANNSVAVWKCIKQRLCAICGTRLASRWWFVGGPGSAFHPNGMYFDSGMHGECMRYALQVCPYLATPARSRINDNTLAKLETRISDALLVDRTHDPKRPPLFVAVMCSGQSLEPNDMETPYLRPLRPYQDVEFWRDGQLLQFEIGVKYVTDHKDLDASALRLVLKKKGY
jgi:hypothetical protein